MVNPRLLRLYERELAHLRESASEFGKEHESAAGYLGLKSPQEPDPHVERLLEGVAYLGARVQLKMEDQFPEFTHHLLQAIQPHYLAPIPSICIAGFEPIEGDPALNEGFVVGRGTELVAEAIEGETTPVRFRSGHDVVLWPIKVTQCEYLSSRAAAASFAQIAGVRAEAALRLRIETTGGVDFSDLPLDSLPIYLDGSEMLPGELYRQLIGDQIAVIAGSPDSGSGAAGWKKVGQVEQVGFNDEEALLPVERRSFRGYRILSEYFACPERFLFAGLTGLKPAMSIGGNKLDIVILLSRTTSILVNALEPSNFKLFATPAINLFEKQLGRVVYSAHEHEFHVVPDRAKPLDFEVFRITDIGAYTRQNTLQRRVMPLYEIGGQLFDQRDSLFYTTRLRQRRLSTREQRLRNRRDYVGTECWIMLTAPNRPELLDDIAELAIKAWVTNRELPALLRFSGTSHFKVVGVPARKVNILRSPTAPRPPMGIGTLNQRQNRESPFGERIQGDAAWRIIGHLTPNYLSLADEIDGDPSILRDHLALYGRRDDAASQRHIDSLLEVRAEPITRRVPGARAMSIARGHRIRIKLDDAAFDLSRMFLFASVLERFLAEFASINSFTECHFESQTEGKFASWPPRIGRRKSI
ncbi:MAG: type VI secretion system baseplate subunit TssF [Novosphingobium sp.]|nr:type VI secretion system baseplate subunit TssF [Novosphingobium sp.]